MLESLIDELAAIEHERWSHWQRYMHSKCERRPDGSLVLPAELVRRWDAQSSTSYAALSESEKESDREQVRRYLPLIAAVLAERDS
ncbi:hypothetical protein WME76_46575 (plasmid) [Sorangium sp. So ce119]|uniref:hypothetical protein n=1 Tax=Sorangium sp. So ce119 TaxID=3133279 RepID=UPI003F64876A